MGSNCFPAGFSYLAALGFGLMAVVLSSWLVLLMRAIYRESGGFRTGLANATPLWVPGLTGVVALFPIGNSLVDWADRCLPAGGWAAPGAVTAGLGLALALTAVGRLIHGRVRLGGLGEPIEKIDKSRFQHSPADSVSPPARARRIPPERLRVIVEFALTFGVAILTILAGVGLAWV